jgi:hypothetical protein
LTGEIVSDVSYGADGTLEEYKHQHQTPASPFQTRHGFFFHLKVILNGNNPTIMQVGS